AALCDQRMVAQFFQSELGRRTLHAERVMREWSFTLRVSEPMDTVLQGVIDLCFLEQNAWVLVDFKTDRVQSAQELLVRYRRQLSFYRQALTRATPHPVRECALFSLRLGKAATLCGDFDEM
ncbi:MAG: PD-(D/E)XK nuclease family protein, partial [Clostridia bacterium]